MVPTLDRGEHREGRWGRIFVLATIVIVARPVAVLADGPLFTKPIHVTRVIEEPLTGIKATVEQYYFANQVASVQGPRTVLVDYQRKDITEIDRVNGTYAQAKFEDVAKARLTHPTARSTDEKVDVVRGGSDRRANRDVDTFTVEDRVAGFRGEIAVDTSIALSRDALDVVIGAAYPATGGRTADAARQAAKLVVAHAASATPVLDTYGFPIEQKFRWDVGGETITASNIVVRVVEELPPADLVAVPAGARLVDSALLRGSKLGEEVDSPPSGRHR